MKQNETNLVQKSSNKFCCEQCDYVTSRRSQYLRHLSTDKHYFRTNETELKQESSTKFHLCECGKKFNSRTTLWRHRKTCDGTFSNGISPELVMETIKEMTHVMLQQNNTINTMIQNGVNNNQSHNTNSLNKTFNLQFFLNETCKNAMNISEFITSIQPDLNDLEHTGRQGYVEGISNIIIKNLNNLENHMRPLHCSNLKQEVLYIKNDGEWLKEKGNHKPILTNAIKVIANKNIRNISEWTKEYPDCTCSESRKNDLYLKIVSNSMNGLTQEETNKNIVKIISNIAKEVVIDKN